MSMIKLKRIVKGPITTPVEGGSIRRVTVELVGDEGFVVLSDAQHGVRPLIFDETVIFRSDSEGNVTSFTEIWGERETRLEEVLGRMASGISIS